MALTGVSYNTTPASPAPSGTLGKDDFLKLMMAQLSQQDPTAPVDSTAFTAQLAQFTTLEQMKNQSQALDALVLAQAAGNQLATASLVGKHVTYHSDSVDFDGATPATVGGTVGPGASQVTLTVTDASGKKVRTVQLGALPEGPLSWTWDGRDDAGATLGKGTFTVSLAAADAEGENVSATTWGSGRVDGISFENGFAELVLGDRRVNLSDVLRINESEPSP